MSQKPVKLLSAWFGAKPRWFPRFVGRMLRSRLVDWECLPPRPDGATRKWQIGWVLDRAAKHGLASNKTHAPNVHVEAMCDLRPCYPDVFPYTFAGYGWWGWCDLDLYLSPRFDDILGELLTPDVDVVTFKDKYLSGCLTVIRNEERFRRAYRLGRWREVLLDPRYHCWDESGSVEFRENYLDLLLKAGARVTRREDLYGYRAPAEPIPCWEADGRLYSDGREVAFVHFMDDVWPIGGES